MSHATMGVYAVQNLVTGRAYIGSTVNIRNRWYRHQAMLRQGYHTNGDLRRDSKQYGAAAFSLVVLETVESERDLLAAERRWIEALDPETLYNDAKRLSGRKPSGPN